MQIDQSRHRRHAARNNVNGIVEPSKKFYPPKPPKDLPTPVPRRIPPPPPPLNEEMFHNQHETVQPRTNTQPRFSGVSKSPAKIETNSAKYYLKPSSEITTVKPSPKTPAAKTTSKEVTKAKKSQQITTTKKVVKTEAPVKPTPTKKSEPKPYVKSEPVNHEQNAVTGLEVGESPKEASNAEAGLELQALIGSTNAAHDHGHTHEHAHDHSHAHAHAHAHKEVPKPKPANSNNGPPAEMQAKFSSMFNAWYNAKFGDAQNPTTVATTTQPKYITAKSKQTKQPSRVYTQKKRPGPVTKSVDKNALFEEFMTMFQNQLNGGGEIAKPATKYPEKVTTKTVKTNAPTIPPTTTKFTAAPTTKVQQTKTSPLKLTSKTPNANSLNAKFGPRNKNDYLQPTTQTTQIYPSAETTAAASNDPTQVQLVTLLHPESLVFPSNESTQPALDSNMTSPQGGSTPAAHNAGSTDMHTEVHTHSNKAYNDQVLTRGQNQGTSTVRPTIDPDLLNDINEARLMQGLPEVQAHQVDLQGNILPFYKRQMRIGRFPARHHPLHNGGGMHHQLQHHHNVPHFHPEQGIDAGFNSFPNLFYPQPTNNGASMAYEPFPRPNLSGPTTPAPKTRVVEPMPETVNVAPIPMVDTGPLTSLAYFYFFSALNNLLHPQNNGGYMAQLFGNGNGQGYNLLFNPNNPINGMPDSNAFSQLSQSHASQQNHASEHTHASKGAQSSKTNGIIHGDLGGGSHSHSNLDLHHQAIHREAGNAMTPNLHRQVHRLLRNRELSRQRGNMFGMQNFPVTQTPFIDPDLYADMMEARAAALAG